MGRNLLKKMICAGLISGSIFVGNMVEAGVVTDRLPLTCYADHKVITYNSPGVKSVGYISANVDLIQITQVRGDGWCYGSYPGAGGRRVSRWFKITDVCADAGYTNRSANVKGRQTVYRTRSGGATIGSVSNNEGVIVVADNGSRAQIVYRLDNGTGYKLGWVPSAAVPPPVPKPVILKGDVNGDGKIDAIDAQFATEIFLGDRAYNPAADINNDGQVTAQDLSTIRELAKPLIDPVNNRQKAMVDKARKYLGSNSYNGYCQRFVRVVGQGIGLPEGSASSALDACNKWRVATNRNIPVGAAVYLRGKNKSTNGYKYGHVGIYSGNGMVIHALTTVKEQSLDSLLKTFDYLGWGWQAGVDLR